MKKKKFVGLTALLPLALFHFISLPVCAEVIDFQTADTSVEETSAECEVIYKSTYDFSEEIPKYPEIDVTAFGYEGIYDGKSHGITVDCKTEGATILYSTDGKTYSTKKPEYTNVGTYVTYYKVEKDGYTTTTGSAVVKIKEATIEFDADDCIVFYDGKKHSIDLSVKTDDCQILYSEDGINFTSKKPEYIDVGTYVTYYKVEKDGYTTTTGSAVVKIKEAMIEFDVDDSIVFYDGKNHSIDLSVKTDDCQILYSEDGINYSSKKPEYREPGTYVVYYKIMRDNYATVTGSSTVTIKAKDGAVNDNRQNSNNQKNSSQTDGNADAGISRVQTGDESHIFFYAVMLIGSTFGLTRLKKSREEKRKL